ncbi:OmpA domain protein [Plesiocystis pacifica SIR-1]|uniref:OmpA domain protein n=1 Tax=Plesiocystis pacifica SIR-1 TaxID=391625 RepID=A6GEF1_9BACT|nr:OmpA family protein [Plesiocystis pacifica]EDM75723.1 OmpA domain protein [Plesiocystis pacifica SIR-1]
MVSPFASAAPEEGADGDASAEAGGEASLSLGDGASAAADGDASADGDADAGGDASAGGGAAKPKKAKDRGDEKWINRWEPEGGMTEIGIYGGVFFPSPNHEIFEPSLDLGELQGWKELPTLAPDIGLRVGYYPGQNLGRFFGLEAEGGVMPSSVDGGNALLYHVRGHLVGQLGLWSVTPFVVLGAGGMGVSSERAALGNDIDPILHFGAGVKVYINRYVMLRLDIRDNVSHKQSVDLAFRAHNPEVLLGLSVTLGREKAKPAGDRDGDGLTDDVDSCPDEPETVNDYQDEDGCPEPDSDGDGFIDDKDTCPNEAETVNDYQDEDGCPESDRDGDGFWDDQDSCPDEAETVNDYKDEDGCPESDRDGDGILDELDKCPDEPETANGYQDEDGCADEVPKEVAAFTGAIKGITFETDSDKIRKSSTRTLDKAVKVLTDFPDIRIKVTGHTDSRGDHDHNVDLSKRRAESVKTYLVEHGIDASRITTDGFGPDKPVDTNDTRAGRANNRRIEFEIVQRAK